MYSLVVSAKNESLSESHPLLSTEAFGWDPSAVTRGSTTKLEWKCSNGHVFTASPNSRTRVYQDKDSSAVSKVGTACPYCANQKILVGFNDLKTTHSELALEARNWDPTTVIAGSNKKRTWACRLGHTWEATISSRALNRTGCPFCSNKRVLSGFNDIASLNPEIAKQADGWDPAEVLNGSARKMRWRCSQNHHWITSVQLRTLKGFGCPYCSNQKLLIGFNDLATTHPEIAAEAFDWNPTSVTAGSSQKKAWRCQMGHDYYSVVRDRAQRKTNCVFCTGKQVLTGFNDLKTTHPEIAAQAFGWNPEEVSLGSNKKLEWICELGHIWKSMATNRIRENSGCPYCKNKSLLVGFNDLQTTEPELSLEAYGWDPSTVINGSGLKKKWKCLNGHVWSATVISRTSDHRTGCPTCAKTGFDPNQTGYLYFLEHPDWEMQQIGITNHPDERIRRHERRGWIIQEIRGPMEGHLARSWETSILKTLKQNGIELGDAQIAGRFDGYSESWRISQFRAKSLFTLMEMVKDYE